MSNLNWLYGCTISLFGSIIGNIGTNTQKYGFLQNAQKPPEFRKPYMKLKLWWIGLILVFISGVCDLVALSMAAQSIISPIGSTALLSNVFFAYFWLKEQVNWRDFAAMTLIVIGSTLSVAFGDHDDSHHTIDELEDLYESNVYIVYISLISAFFLIGILLLWYIGPQRVALASALTNLQTAMNGGDEQRSLYAPVDVTQIAEAHANVQRLKIKYAPWKNIHPLLFCALGGICSSQSILLAKSLAELVSEAFDGDSSQFASFLPYVFLLALALCIVGQLHFFALALDLFDSSYVQPTYKVFFLILSTIGGGCYFQEFGDFELIQWIFFPFGIVMNLCGVYILSYREMVRATAHLMQIEKENSLAEDISEEERQSIYGDDKSQYSRNSPNGYRRLSGDDADSDKSSKSGTSSESARMAMTLVDDGHGPKTLSLSSAQLEVAIDGSLPLDKENGLSPDAARTKAAADELLSKPATVSETSEKKLMNPLDSGRSPSEHMSYGSHEQFRATAPTRMKYSPTHPVMRLRAQQDQLIPAATMPTAAQMPTGSVQSTADAADQASAVASAAGSAPIGPALSSPYSSASSTPQQPQVAPVHGRSSLLGSSQLSNSGSRSATGSGPSEPRIQESSPKPPLPPIMRRAVSLSSSRENITKASPLAKFMMPFAFSPSNSFAGLSNSLKEEEKQKQVASRAGSVSARYNSRISVASSIPKSTGSAHSSRSYSSARGAQSHSAAAVGLPPPQAFAPPSFAGSLPDPSPLAVSGGLADEDNFDTNGSLAPQQLSFISSDAGKLRSPLLQRANTS